MIGSISTSRVYIDAGERCIDRERREQNRMNLTPRQSDALATIRDYLIVHQYSPAVKDVADGMGVSRSVAENHLRALEDAGEISRTPGVARSITCIAGE